MAKVPPFLYDMLLEIPEGRFKQVFQAIKISEHDVFKKYARANASSERLYTEFALSIASGNIERSALQSIYNSVEGVFFIGGCAPGIGIAFNVLDATFCFLLGDWIGCFVAIISCFPIPGFKFAGKGIEKFLISLLERIQPARFISIINKLGEKLINIGFHNDKSYIIIREQIEKLVLVGNNPFSELIIELTNVIKRFPTSQKGISSSVSKSGVDLYYQATVLPKLLEITLKNSHL